MNRRIGIMLAGLLLLVIILSGLYIGVGLYYQTHFFEDTMINGIDVSGMTADEAEEQIAGNIENYSLKILTREGAQETINGDEIGYRFLSKGEVQSFLRSQDYLMWLLKYIGTPDIYTMDTSVAYDQNLLRQKVTALSCMQEANTTAPVDASLQRQDGTYVIVPEVEGNQLDTEKTVKAVAAAIDSGAQTVSLLDQNCYKEPSVRAEDGALKSEAAIRNKYASVSVAYDMGNGVTEVLDAATTSEWFSLGENMQMTLNRDAVAAWVNQLADKYDTIGVSVPFTTSNQETVYVEARTYGWQMDRESETEALYQQLLLGESTTRTPIWYESAGVRNANGIGDTYVEIDYTNQHLWFYKNGALIVETPVVTGNVSAGNASPEGIFCLAGKEENAVLKGEGYSQPVSYWMPFYGGVGIHDADTWRSTYGGDIYQTGGSHGCINTPTAQVAQIYQNIEVGTPIICYSSGVNRGYALAVVNGSGTGENANGSANESANGSDNGGTNGTPDIVIIDNGGGTVTTGGEDSGTTDGSNTGGGSGTITQGITDDGVPYTGEDLQDVIIIQ